MLAALQFFTFLYSTSPTIYTICLRLYCNSRIEHDMEMKLNMDPSTSLAESQKSLEARGCKPWVTNSSSVPHTLGTLTTSITCCVILLEYVNKSQVNAIIVLVVLSFGVGMDCCRVTS